MNMYIGNPTQVYGVEEWRCIKAFLKEKKVVISAIPTAKKHLHCTVTTSELYRRQWALKEKKVSDATEVPMENIVISSTHTHQGPEATINSENELVKEYTEFLGKRITDAAIFAIADLKEAKMGYGKGVAPNVAFIRRYLIWANRWKRKISFEKYNKSLWDANFWKAKGKNASKWQF